MSNVVITDSGLGGLSVVAPLVEKIGNSSLHPHKIIFVNALPDTHRGYNTMPDTETKINMFNRVLYGIEKQFKPDMIAIACNTLSAIADRTSFARSHDRKLMNIIDLAIRYGRQRVFDLTGIHNKYVVFATETTIDSHSYEQRLKTIGVASSDIISVPCPGLASQIELNYRSTDTASLVKKCVSKASQNLHSVKKPVYVILGCTHYGYVADLFTAEFNRLGINNTIFVNPNHYMVEEICQRLSINPAKQTEQRKGLVSVHIYSRCKILPEEITSVSKLIEPISKQTADALRNYELRPNLF